MRCVNIDWLEVYCLESNDRYPCNADYFRRQGYLVNERDYGTRQYKEMFVIVDEDNNPLIEIRRNPKAGESDFSGFLPQSTHLRIPNWRCYQDDIVSWLREFLVRHDYIFKRIFRIDICYDFEYFDSGDQPARFARRYLERVYRKINQCRISTHGSDGWNDFEWETISWGKPTSMVSTKMYNKSKELSSPKNDKPYIRSAWFVAGLVDNPISCTKRDRNGKIYNPEIWRVEFSMKSSADNWIVIEDQSGKKEKKKAIPHNFSLFDSKEKLWQRFQDLAYHYFHFKYREYKDEETAIARIALNAQAKPSEKPLKRKDRCRDKILFHWDKDHVFAKLTQPPPPSKPNSQLEILRRRLIGYQAQTCDPKLRAACEAILKALESREARRLTPHHLFTESRALQAAIAIKLGGDQREALEILKEVEELLANDQIF